MLSLPSYSECTMRVGRLIVRTKARAPDGQDHWMSSYIVLLLKMKVVCVE